MAAFQEIAPSPFFFYLQHSRFIIPLEKDSGLIGKTILNLMMDGYKQDTTNKE